MKPKLAAYITESSERYLVVDSDGNCLDSDDRVGFSTKEAAQKWAEANGYKVDGVL